MSYTNSDRFSVSGTKGALIIPTHWVSEIQAELPMYTFWQNFLAKNVGTEVVLGEGQGKTFKISYLQDTAISTTPLVAGTNIATASSTGLGQATGTLAEYGKAERIENLQAFVSNSDVYKSAGMSMFRNAMRTRNALIGASYIASTNYFTIDDATTVTYNSGDTTDGASPILPTHIRQMVAQLRRAGIAPDIDGLYTMVYAPGMIDGVIANADEYVPLASLANVGLGVMYKYGGVKFIEESGANAVTTYGANKKSVIFGGNALAGYDDILRGDIVKYYLDDENDFERTGKIGWKGLYGATLICDASTNARSYVIYSSN